MVAMKLVALYLGDDIFGQVAYAMGIVGILNSVFAFGFPKAHVKRLSEGGREGDKIVTYATIRFALVAALLVLVLGAVVVWTIILDRRFHSTTRITVVLRGAYFALQNLQRLTEKTFVAYRHIARNQLVEFTESAIRSIGAALVSVTYAAASQGRGPLAGHVSPAWDWVVNLGPELLALAYVASAAFAAGVGFLYLLQEYPRGSFDKELLSSYWDFAKPVFIVSVVATAANYLDRATLGFFWSGSEAGIYFAAQRVTLVVSSLAFAIGSVLMPKISALAEEGAHEEIARTAGRAHRYVSMLVVPIVAFMIVFATEIIRILLSEDFLGGGPTLGMLALYGLFSALIRPYGSIVMGMDLPRTMAKINLGTALVNVTLNLVLVPADVKSLGIELFGLAALGAAAATTTGSALTYVFARYKAGQLVDVRPQWWHSLRHVLAAGGMIALLLWLHGGPFPLVRWYHLPAYATIGGLAYFLLLVPVREFDGDDLELMLEILNVANMIEYLRDELTR
jgi:putative peptidoglycan lipid II flippase